jgi:plasmid maintenance system antidote protein VapI
MSVTKDLKILKDQIKKSGLKKGKLAEVIGIHPTTLSSFLSGKRQLGLAAKKSLYRELGLELNEAS